MLYNIGVLVTFLLCVIGFTILTLYFNWVKKPRDALVFGGMNVSLGAFVAIFWPLAVPGLIVAISVAWFLWKKTPTPESK
jgi:hypothetical protein